MITCSAGSWRKCWFVAFFVTTDIVSCTAYCVALKELQMYVFLSLFGFIEYHYHLVNPDGALESHQIRI